MNEGIIKAIEDAPVIVFDTSKTFSIADLAKTWEMWEKNKPPYKGPSQLLKEFIDAHFETEEEKMNFLKFYMDSIVPEIAKSLL